MSIDRKTISIEALAPAKPGWGAPCNGCGVCCLAEPCPVGMVLSLKRRGACDALHWDPVQARYRCGAIVQPAQVLRAVLPLSIRILAPAIAQATKSAGVRRILEALLRQPMREGGEALAQ